MKNPVNYISKEQIALCDMYKNYKRFYKEALSKRKDPDTYQDLTEEEFKIILKNFDKYYDFSDDIRVWRNGEAYKKSIMDIIKVHPEYDQIWTDFNVNDMPLEITSPANPDNDVWYAYRLYQMDITDSEYVIVTDTLNSFKSLDELRLYSSKDMYLHTPDTPRYVRDENACKVRQFTLLTTEETDRAATIINRRVRDLIRLLKLKYTQEIPNGPIVYQLDVWNGYETFKLERMPYNSAYDVITYKRFKLILKV